jgi:hypothetical protein
MDIEFDAGKDEVNRLKHGVPLALGAEESIRMSGASRCHGAWGLGRIVVGEAGIPFLEERPERAIALPMPEC